MDHFRNHYLHTIRDQIKAAVLTAQNQGCSLVGFGQFTSIITHNCQALVVPGIQLTTGNTLTLGMAFTAVEETVRKRNRAFDRLSCGVLGAAGNIGSTFARLMADRVKTLILVGGTSGTSHHRLAKTVDLIIQDQALMLLANQPVGPIGLRLQQMFSSDELKQIAETGSGQAIFFERSSIQPRREQCIQLGDICDIKDAEIVITATNTTQPFILPEHLKDEAIVCDVSIPTALTPQALKKPGIEAFKGGVVALPHREQLNIGALPLEPGLVYACMAETILLGLENKFDDFSIGDIKKNRVLEILAIARKHGFSLARLKCEDSVAFS